MSEEIHPDDPRFVLRPCPFCGSSNISKAPRYNLPVSAYCRDCECNGPSRITGIEADIAWNERKEPQ